VGHTCQHEQDERDDGDIAQERRGSRLTLIGCEQLLPPTLSVTVYVSGDTQGVVAPDGELEGIPWIGRPPRRKALPGSGGPVHRAPIDQADDGRARRAL
jgi:hypothetical protein